MGVWGFAGMMFRTGDLVRVKGSVIVGGMRLSGSVGLVVGLEASDYVPSGVHEAMNREIPYVIISCGVQTYVWEEEIEKLEVE